LGYAPEEYTRLYEAARKTFTDEVIEATGLAKRGDRGWYDFFRGRVTFPIRDAQGRIVGFGARLLDPEAKAQKYLNSAEGLLFSKSKLLYAIDRLAHSERLKSTGRVLVMEGYTDVIAAHEAGFDNAVAPLGTALTREQLGLMRRYGKGVTLVLDGDAAGQAAAERAVNVALEAGVDANVAVIRDAKDPFDLLRAKGPEAFEQMLAKAVDAFEFKLAAVRNRFDLSRPIEAEAALRDLAESFGRADSQSLRELYARRVAGLLSLREAVVLAALSEAHTRHARTANRPGEQTETQPVAKAAGTDPRIAYERELLRRMLEHPRAIAGAASIVFPEVFSVPALRELYREMLNAWDEHGEVVPGALVTHLGPEARAELQEVVKHMTHDDEATAPQPDADAAAALLIDELRKLAEHKPAIGKAQDLAALRDQKLARKGPKGPKRA
jgi:DNA primase